MNFISIQDLKLKIINKQLSVDDVLNYYLKRFQEHDSKIGSALEIFNSKSIKENYINNDSGLLNGIPGLIKDNICQAGRITSCASKILQNYRASYNATAIKKLQEHGALLIGRANMDEFAMGSSTETSAYQLTRNPWDFSCVPGGSSGGSIAAVAAGLVPWSLGSETGGSVRQPAALCGIVGLKPTYGLISRYGLIAYGSSLDQIGIATRTVYDNALVLSAIAGNDPMDGTTRNIQAQDYTANLDGKITSGMTIGVIENALNAQGMDSEVLNLLTESLKVFEKLGAKIKYIKLPSMDYCAAVYFIVSRAEAASNLSRFDGVRYGYRDKNYSTLQEMYANTRTNGFGDEVKRRILIGNYVLSAGHAQAYYNSAKTVQAMVRQEFLECFKDVNLLFSPVTPTPAFKFGAFDDNKLQMDLQDYFTAAANLTGFPAISIPCGFTKSKMPIGLQLIGPDLSEMEIFKTAYAYEQANNWHKIYPATF